jgi:hypothetical protein
MINKCRNSDLTGVSKKRLCRFFPRAYGSLGGRVRYTGAGGGCVSMMMIIMVVVPRTYHAGGYYCDSWLAIDLPAVIAVLVVLSEVSLVP